MESPLRVPSGPPASTLSISFDCGPSSKPIETACRDVRVTRMEALSPHGRDRSNQNAKSRGLLLKRDPANPGGQDR
ncbi:uncharacterized protein P884DRAFT_30953 [Thermothelomyces heterothallicus CBS 202.75]|uniref:uncharacterized protein n=1 Tax=Thermothelomyces heterothallicus CBS 202.75 TaxID=1149848 RepID=UPI0037428BCF